MVNRGDSPLLIDSSGLSLPRHHKAFPNREKAPLSPVHGRSAEMGLWGLFLFDILTISYTEKKADCMNVSFITDPELKESITLSVMHQLPLWFSPPEDIDYKAKTHRNYPFLLYWIRVNQWLLPL